MKTLLSILLAAAAAGLGCGNAPEVASLRVQDPPAEPPTCVVQRTAAGIVVDGTATDADWQKAAPIEFVFPWNSPDEGERQSTVARLLWDDENLYLVYECADPYLDAQVTAHDGPVYAEDAVEIFATPNAADVSAYYGYEMNINGALLDYSAFKGGAERTPDLEFPWQSEGVVIRTTYRGTLNDHQDRDEGWVLEMAIPMDNFRHLGGRIPPQDGDTWRLNLNRTAGHQGQFCLWSDTHTPRPNFHRSLHFGTAVFSSALVGAD